MSQGQIEQLGTPTEIYRNPSTVFVARFIGSMNELPATVVDAHTVRVLDVPVHVGRVGTARGRRSASSSAREAGGHTLHHER